MGTDQDMQHAEKGSHVGHNHGEARSRQGVWACHGCKDIFFALLFYAFLISNIVLCIQYKDDARHVNISTSGGHVEKYAMIALGIACASCILWIVMMWACAGCMIYTAFLFIIGVLACVAVYAFSIGMWFVGVVIGAMALLVVLYFFCIRSRIDLATRMIHICAKVMFMNPFIFLAAFAVVCSIVAYITLILATALRVCGHFHYDDDDDKSAWGMFFYFVFLGFWGLEVCRNTVHVTSCGVLGQYYFNDNAMAAFPQLVKAVTVQFGSICFGSLLVALIETIRVIVSYIQEKQQEKCDNCCCRFLFCCIQCCLGCIQWCVQRINAYAYVICAIEGEGFCHAAVEAIRVLEVAGMTSLVNDDIIHKLIFVGSFIGGLCIGAFCGSLGYKNDDFSENEAWAWGLTFGISCYFFLTLMLSPLLSMVQALLVCFAQDPVTLHVRHPETYDDLIKAWKEVYPDGGPGEVCCVKHAEGKVSGTDKGTTNAVGQV